MHRVELSVTEKGLRNFMEYHDESIAEMVRCFEQLDYIDAKKAVKDKCEGALMKLKRGFKSLAKDSIAFMVPSQLKELIY